MQVSARKNKQGLLITFLKLNFFLFLDCRVMCKTLQKMRDVRTTVKHVSLALVYLFMEKQCSGKTCEQSVTHMNVSFPSRPETQVSWAVAY